MPQPDLPIYEHFKPSRKERHASCNSFTVSHSMSWSDLCRIYLAGRWSNLQSCSMIGTTSRRNVASCCSSTATWSVNCNTLQVFFPCRALLSNIFKKIIITIYETIPERKPIKSSNLVEARSVPWIYVETLIPGYPLQPPRSSLLRHLLFGSLSLWPLQRRKGPMVKNFGPSKQIKTQVYRLKGL